MDFTWISILIPYGIHMAFLTDFYILTDFHMDFHVDFHMDIFNRVYIETHYEIIEEFS